ncbi:unnamed protein product [Coregonus sp. 'balchen']|nr:unnamed protein product [Coregonus sp. 'balchen']
MFPHWPLPEWSRPGARGVRLVGGSLWKCCLRPCPSHTAMADQPNPAIPIMSRGVSGLAVDIRLRGSPETGEVTALDLHQPALNKKEHRGCDSPDPDASYVLTPHTEEKYKKINEEFDNMMRNHKIPTALPQQNFSMHVAVPVSNQNTMSYNPGGSMSSHALAQATASLSDSGMLSPPQASLHRNVGSSGGQQRPPSQGNAGGMLGRTDLAVPAWREHQPSEYSRSSRTNSLGLCGSAQLALTSLSAYMYMCLRHGNGFVNPRGSPGLLGATSGNGLGKVMPTKSPPPPGGNMGMGNRKPDLRVLIPPSSKGMMPPLSEEEKMDLNTHRISSSQSQLLATPVVSVTTPSLPPQGLVYSGMPTGYNTGESTPLSPATYASALPDWLILIGLVSCEYSLSSAEISSLQGFGAPGLSLGSMSAWQQHQLGQAALSSLVGGGHLPQGSNLSINTSQNINIKSEPISPPRERVTSSGFPQQQQQHQQQQQASSRQDLGRSPVDSLSSSCSSYDGSDREDHRPDFHSSSMGLGRPPAGTEDNRESPSVKRMRMDTWVT